MEFAECIRTCDEKHISDRGRIKALEDTTKRIYEILDTFRGRPSWIIVGVITVLATGLGITMTELIHLWGK